MADIKKMVQEAGQKIAETATKAGHRISEGAEQAADWVKERAHEVGHRADESAQKATHSARPATSGFASTIHEHMDVITSCRTRLGRVDRVEGSTIKLTKTDLQAGGQHHFIPLDWVVRVDQQVHLNKNFEDAVRNWKAEPAEAM